MTPSRCKRIHPEEPASRGARHDLPGHRGEEDVGEPLSGTAAFSGPKGNVVGIVLAWTAVVVHVHRSRRTGTPRRQVVYLEASADARRRHLRKLMASVDGTVVAVGTLNIDRHKKIFRVSSDSIVTPSMVSNKNMLRLISFHLGEDTTIVVNGGWVKHYYVEERAYDQEADQRNADKGMVTHDNVGPAASEVDGEPEAEGEPEWKGEVAGVVTPVKQKGLLGCFKRKKNQSTVQSREGEPESKGEAALVVTPMKQKPLLGRLRR